MKRAFLLFTVLLLPFTPLAFGRVPQLNVKAICKARSVDAKIMQSTPDQSVADCMRDEEAAKQDLSPVWASTSVPTRNLCESDARALGTRSYLDLLTCIQMAEYLKSAPQKKTEK
jgi:hypothetical protein